MSTSKPWLHRNYLLVILACLLLAALIWWIFHQRIERIENQLQENSRKQALHISARPVELLTTQSANKRYIYA